MNPGKLEDLAVLDQIFTPSFNLLELEARILQHGQLEELARSIAHCVRCGKCKPDCCVYHPARGMFFHPRNKNLAIGSLIEALLYDAQRERSTRFELLRWLEDVADHCTICHKCLKPCPVDIDSGAVSILEREILQSWGYKNTTLATRAALSVPRQPLAHLQQGVPVHGGAARRRGAARRLRARRPAPARRRAARRLPAPAAPLADAAHPGGDAARRHPPLRARPGPRVRAGALPGRRGARARDRAATATASGTRRSRRGRSSTSRAAARSATSRTSRWRRCTSC